MQSKRLRRALGAGLCALGACVLALPAGAQSAPPCARTTIAARRLPTGPAQYQSGSLRLSNGASMRLQGSPGELYQVKGMRLGDPVAACYGPPKMYADAGPSRSITVLDLKNGSFYGSLIGTWKGR